MLAHETFLLDANVFIEPKNRYYPFDIFPGYWEFLSQELGGESVKSIEHVYDELLKGTDELSTWAKQLGRKSFEGCSNDSEVFSKYLEVADYVGSLEGENQGQKRKSAIDAFLREGVADPWLVAHASVYDETIVTQEVSHSLKVSKVSLVDVCDYFGVRHIEVVSFLREAKARFVLQP